MAFLLDRDFTLNKWHLLTRCPVFFQNVFYRVTDEWCKLKICALTMHFITLSEKIIVHKSLNRWQPWWMYKLAKLSSVKPFCGRETPPNNKSMVALHNDSPRMRLDIMLASYWGQKLSIKKKTSSVLSSHLFLDIDGRGHEVKERCQGKFIRT